MNPIEETSAESQRGIEVHDILIFRKGRCRRVWLVTGVVYGSSAGENLFQLRPLDLENGSNVDGKLSESLVPMELLFSFMNEPETLEIIHRP